MQQKIKESVDQILYKGKWVDKKYFRVFIYKENGKKLVNSYDEYKRMIDSGEWYEDPIVPLISVKSKARKPKDDGDS